jgi:hypothetical protein
VTTRVFHPPTYLLGVQHCDLVRDRLGLVLVRVRGLEQLALAELAGRGGGYGFSASGGMRRRVAGRCVITLVRSTPLAFFGLSSHRQLMQICTRANRSVLPVIRKRKTRHTLPSLSDQISVIFAGQYSSLPFLLVSSFIMCTHSYTQYHSSSNLNEL